MEIKVLTILLDRVGTSVDKYRLEISLWYRNKMQFKMVGETSNVEVKLTALKHTGHRLAKLTSKENMSKCRKGVGLKQSYCSTDNNKEMKEYNGNKNNKLVIASWNCGKKLFLPDGNPSTKWKETLEFIKTYKVDMMALIETNLSEIKMSREVIHDKLSIPGFRLTLPRSWDVHGCARIIVIAKENIKAEKVKMDREDKGDMPTITMMVTDARKKKLYVNFCYREFKSKVNGLGNMDAQRMRIKRQIAIWREIRR